MKSKMYSLKCELLEEKYVALEFIMGFQIFLQF